MAEPLGLYIKRPVWLRLRSKRVVVAYARELARARGFSAPATQKIIDDPATLALFVSKTFCSLQETEAKLKCLSLYSYPSQREEIYELFHVRLIWQMRQHPETPYYRELRALPKFNKYLEAMHYSIRTGKNKADEEFPDFVNALPPHLGILEKRRILDCVVRLYLYPFKPGSAGAGFPAGGDFRIVSPQKACRTLGVEPEVLKGRRVLGIGVVYGNLVLSLRMPGEDGRPFADAYGIELDPETIAPAAAPYVKAGNAVEKLPWPDEQFDAGFSMQVVGGSCNPIGIRVIDFYLFLRELHRVLRPNAIFIFDEKPTYSERKLARIAGFEVVRELEGRLGTSILQKVA